MPHPYSEFEGTTVWRSLDAALSDLESNRDLALTTARTHVIGYLCKQLAAAGVVTERPSRPSDRAT